LYPKITPGMGSKKKIKLKLIDMNSEDSKSKEKSLEKTHTPIEVRKITQEAIRKASKTKIALIRRAFINRKKL
jgi:tRNA(Phe) wybutosine-synthesizing methylase Tyw3